MTPVRTAPVPPSGIVLRHARTQPERAACFPAISQLRPGLKNVSDWLEQVLDMERDGYRVLAAWQRDRVLAVAGYRIMRNLIHGRFLYVDDLVTAAGERGRGLGAALLGELSTLGTGSGCARLVLDMAATNTAARRFYAREGLSGAIVGFVKPLKPAA